jgi:hypothetical protein
MKQIYLCITVALISLLSACKKNDTPPLKDMETESSINAKTFSEFIAYVNTLQPSEVQPAIHSYMSAHGQVTDSTNQRNRKVSESTNDDTQEFNSVEIIPHDSLYFAEPTFGSFTPLQSEWKWLVCASFFHIIEVNSVEMFLYTSTINGTPDSYTIYLYQHVSTTLSSGIPTVSWTQTGVSLIPYVPQGAQPVPNTLVIGSHITGQLSRLGITKAIDNFAYANLVDY